jgi:hypothetical protein
VPRVMRGGWATVRAGGGDDSAPDALAAVAAAGPPPELVAEVTEECSRLLGLLGDGELRQVAIWKMEGYTNGEIAGKLNRSIPTVERKLAAIRIIWQQGQA